MTKLEILKYVNSEVTFSGVQNAPIGLDDIAANFNTSQETIESLVDQLVQDNTLEYCGIGNTCVRKK